MQKLFSDLVGRQTGNALIRIGGELYEQLPESQTRFSDEKKQVPLVAPARSP